MRVNNQKPQVLSPVHAVGIKGDLDLEAMAHDCVTGPMFEPLLPGAVVTIDDAGTPLDESDVLDLVVACSGDAIDLASEKKLKSLFSKTLVYYTEDDADTASSVFVNQAATKEKMPRPSAVCKYISSDPIDGAKQYLAGIRSFDFWFASLAFYAEPDTLGVSFVSTDAFTEFKTWLKTQAAQLASVFPKNTNQLLMSFDQTMTLTGLTDSMVLRQSMATGNEEMSFPRVLMTYIMQYVQMKPDECALLPFSVGELLIPQTLVFVNVAEHAHATPRAVSSAWKDINDSLAFPIRRISTKQIQKLDAVARSAKKAAAAAAAATRAKQGGAARTRNIRFTSKAPTTVDLTRRISRVIKQMGNVARSQNSYKTVKSSFAKPNRRNPDDFNLQGKVVSTRYKPDIHLYLDNSGSISEENYADMVRTCIHLARKLDVSLYMNTFSDRISDCSYLPTKGRTSRQIYCQFQRIPKVTGGTEYTQVWAYIQADKRRRRELSIIVTDFEYYAPRSFNDYPSNLWYVPCSNMDWGRLTRWAQKFSNEMRHISPNIRKHILM